MTKSAKVLKLNGKAALVETVTDESPCSGCKEPCAERHCSAVKKIKLWADNECDAEISDTVFIHEKKRSKVFLYGLLCLVFPIFTAFAIYSLSISKHYTDAISVGAAFAGFILAQALAAFVCGLLAKRFPDHYLTRSEE